MAYREERSTPESPATSEVRDLPGRTPRDERTAPAAPAPAPAAIGAAEPAVGPKRSRKKAIGLVVLLLALVGGGILGWRYWTNGRFMVSTDDAYVAADITVLASKVSGYVAAIEVGNNQSVQAGDVIARIDDGDYRLAVQSARDKVATLEATAARIVRQVDAAKAQVTQAEPQILSAQAEKIRTDADFDRQTRLSQSDFASKAKFEQSRADRDRADAAVRTAEAALLVARANVDVLDAQRVEADRTADEARTQLARAERDLTFTVIRAPVAGVVGNRAVELGGWVQPGTRFAALVPLASARVDANFKETQLAGVRPGQKAYLEVDAYPGRDFPASVDSIAPASGSQFSLLPPENATGNFTKIVQRLPVRVKIDPEVTAQGLLRPGMSAVVRIDIRDQPAASTPSR